MYTFGSNINCVVNFLWVSAFYGAYQGEHQQMDALRTRALSAIRLRKIGVKSILRLSLSTTPAADPGYWRILQTFDIFHRIVQKEPRLLNLWIFFIGNLREIFLVVFFLNFW